VCARAVWSVLCEILVFLSKRVKPNSEHCPLSPRVCCCAHAEEGGSTSCWVLFVCLLCVENSTLYICVSLSMKFQASRFSASGRKCPLSPTEVKHAAHASPCMFSRLERDVKGVCFVIDQQAFGVCELPCFGGNFELRVQAHHVASQLHSLVYRLVYPGPHALYIYIY